MVSLVLRYYLLQQKVLMESAFDDGLESTRCDDSHSKRHTLQENASLVTNFRDQKLLVTIITNLDTSLQSKNIIGY